ncbi:MAG: ROK family protein [Clostridia bacterium]
MFYLGIDIGGTQIKIGVVDDDMKILAKTSCDTKIPCTQDEFCDTVFETAMIAIKKANLNLSDIGEVGMGFPGGVDKKTGFMKFASNLGFVDFPLKEKMQERFVGKKIKLENDANAAAFGEYKAGALKNTQFAVAITLGTGIGGGIIIDGKIYTSFNYAAGELGHTVIEVDGRECNCGRKGCFETYASATGLIRTTKEFMEKDKNSKMWELVEGDINKVSGRTSFDAMRLGDVSGKKVVDEFIKYLGVGLCNVINTFQPEIICIGGGICNEGETLIAPLRKICENQSYRVDKTTKIVRAELGNDAGIIGAALLDF